MGKKATFLYFDFLTLLFTASLALFTIIVGVGSRSNPNEGILLPLLGLSIVPLIIANLFMLLYWGIRRKLWFVIPLIAVAGNYEYISAKYQFRISSSAPNYKQRLIRIASYNVQAFHDDPSIYSVEEVTGLMKEYRTDIICFQEFAESPYFSIDSIRLQFRDYPYAILCKGGEKKNNLAIFSKFPIINNANIAFNSTKNGAMWVDVKVGKTTLRVFNCHLQTTNFNQTRSLLTHVTTAGFYESKKEAAINIMMRLAVNAQKRANQADMLSQMIDTTRYAIVLCGDFNDIPTSYSYHRIKKLLKDGFQSAGSGFESTYRHFHQLLRIDYIFHSKDLIGTKYQTPSFEFSDHNPVFMELAIKGK
ncbi:endonuclease/exonuclease/phosphatase family protein [Bacteroides sedimenti]|uniref:Endonuclease n=1 Tax=Bacteroides sedimenti TaxID=2136147 RepID=A0ABN6Z8W3_9BACE